MADGSLRAAAKIRRGDYLWNPLTRAAIRVEAVSAGPEKLPLVVVEYEGGGRIRVTTKHPMTTPSGIRAAADLVVGDALLGEDGRFHTVTSIGAESLPPPKMVYNFLLGAMEEGHADRHMIVAEGIVTGDFVLQNLLESGVRFSFADLAPSLPPSIAVR
jgi:hypothetical protein